MLPLLLTDVDGVLTDGGITFDEDGRELKTFNVRDGLGVKLWQRAGGKVGIVTGRTSRVVERRAEELGVTLVRQGVGEKLSVVREVAAQEGFALDQVVFVGDDIPDLSSVRAVGMGVAVADAADELRSAASYVTRARGGCGALREVIEMLLKDAGLWDMATAPLHG